MLSLRKYLNLYNMTEVGGRCLATLQQLISLSCFFLPITLSPTVLSTFVRHFFRFCRRLIWTKHFKSIHTNILFPTAEINVAIETIRPFIGHIIVSCLLKCPCDQTLHVLKSFSADHDFIQL